MQSEVAKAKRVATTTTTEGNIDFSDVTSTFLDLNETTAIPVTTHIQKMPSSQKRSQIGIILGTIAGVLALLVLCLCGEKIYSSCDKAYRGHQGYEAQGGNRYDPDDSDDEDGLMGHPGNNL